MAESDEDQVEILVHITAPSRGIDDAAYRAFANAYLEFEPEKIHNLEQTPLDEPTNIDHDYADEPSIDSQFFQEATWSDTQFPSALKSPVASFNSILENSSPKLIGLTAGSIYQHASVSSAAPSAPLPSSIGNPGSSLELPPLPRSRRGLHEIAEDQTSSGDLQTPDRTPMIPPLPASRVSNTATNPNEIRPPPPRTSFSSAKKQDFFTNHLSDWVNHSLGAKWWKEEFVTRKLRDLERGYWLVDYSTWDAGLRKQSWDFLQNEIGNGKLGWAVWCVRAPERNEIRLYCWGGIVQHTYMALYVISKRALKGTGATWHDGDGKAVVIVPPRR